MKQEPNYRLATPQPDHIMVSISGDAKTSMSITWRTSTDIKDGYVEYYEKGKEKIKLSAVTEIFESDINTSHIHFAVLKDLKPGTRY
ncbi:MAG: fibronectin type III domain-containing protein, partial [Clostridia bacterium]|nr:fibronectin type III domain-containing protein [Clostridia bacterium]